MNIRQVWTLDECITNGLGFLPRGLSKRSSQEIHSKMAPVVQWTIVQTMLILMAKVDLVSAQADIPTAI